MSLGSRIVLTFLNMDVEYDEKWCGGADCTCDYVEILGKRYCGTSLPGPFISCNLDIKVIFQSALTWYDDYWYGNSGFRAEWTEIPDDGECGLHILNHLSCVWCRDASRVPVFR